MAGAVVQVIVSPFLELILDNISSLVRSEFGMLSGVNKDLEKLSETLSTIRLVLDDAETKQIKDKATGDWLRKLKDSAYEADDILEECALEALCPEYAISFQSCTERVSDSLSACFDFKQIIFRHKIGKKIKELIQKFDEIAAERSKFHLNSGAAESGIINEFSHNRETWSVLTEPIVYGRDEDKENGVGVLLDNASSQNHLSICPILGIGGVGKTTLAQLIYNDERVVKQFDTRIWICVSEDFSLKRLTKMIIDYLSEKQCDLVDLDPMQNHLKKLLYGKKFLLVLDDVWDGDQEKWNKVKHLLTCGDKGSSLIVTTRLQTVVDSISLQTATCIINPTLCLKFLLEQDCWDLFKQYAFGMGNEEINPVLIEIGKEIVRKCGGVPLAVKAVGSLLHLKSSEQIWRSVRDSDIWNLKDYGENTILPALRLSYNHLEPLLRQCFAYCSIYPKDHTISKQQLIHEWMANGFIVSTRTMVAEDIGDEIFSGLLQRSFFQGMQKIRLTNEVFFNMHDLMHDLARSVMVNECSVLNVNDDRNVATRIRHVSVMCESLPSPATLKTFSRSQPFFRTLLVSRSRTPLAMNLLLASFSRLKCLRVLDLSHLWNIESLAPQIGHIKHLRYLNLRNTGIASLPKFVYKQLNLQTLVLSYNEKFTLLPSSIENLKHLRYLDLSNTGITILPESICSLTDLRTLKLKSPKLKMLPKCMRNMRSLRHVEMYPDHAKLTGMPVGIGELTSFQTLSLFVVSPTREFAGIQELGRLHQLKGLLMIKGLRHVPHQNDAQQANLMSKNLSELYLLWSGDGVDVDSSQEINSKEVLEGLQPHANVQKLWIEGYPGVIFPSWVGSSTALPTLTSLTLNDMPNLEGWSSEHLLPSRLKALRIGKCPKLTLPTLPSSIEKLTVERCNDPTLSSVENLPHLSFLEVFGFDEIETLREVPLGNHTSLETLYIMNFRKLKSLSNNLENLTTLANLRIVGCGELDSISEGLQNLASLQDFRLCALPKLKSLSLQALTALQILELNTCRILDVSVVEFQHLVALRELKLRKLPQLTSLPEGIRNVTTLENLEIWSCRSMTKLPEWLQHLPALVSLKIQDCHADLHKRCEKDNGEYWPKISHLRVYNEIAF